MYSEFRRNTNLSMHGYLAGQEGNICAYNMKLMKSERILIIYYQMFAKPHQMLTSGTPFPSVPVLHQCC